MDYEDLVLERLSDIAQLLEQQIGLLYVIAENTLPTDDDEVDDDVDECDNPFQNVQPIGELE